MTKTHKDLVVIGDSCEAEGHPSVCSEPASGSVKKQSDITIHYDGKKIAAETVAKLNFPSHGHDVGPDGGCVDDQEHNFQPSTVIEHVTYDGNKLYLDDNAIASDPGTGGDVNMTSTET